MNVDHSFSWGLSWIIFLPLLGAVLQAVTPKPFLKYAAIGGVGASALSAVGAWVLVNSLDSTQGAGQLSESVNWIASFSIRYHVALDGASAAAFLLVATVFPVVLLQEWNQSFGRPGIFALLLLLETALLGAITAQDLFVLFFFWALSGIPQLFLVAIWGGEKREEAGFRALVAASVGSAFFLAALLVAYYAGSPHSFSIIENAGGKLEATGAVTLFGAGTAGAWIMGLLGTAFLFRLPIWPIHGWYTELMAQAPASIGAALSLQIPVGLSVFSRLGLVLLPSTFRDLASTWLGLGTLCVCAAAVSVWAARDLKRTVAQLGVMLTGAYLIGMGSLSAQGHVGATFLVFGWGLAIAGIGLFGSFVEQRAGGTEWRDEKGVTKLGGWVGKTPRAAASLGVLVSSLVGAPGAAGFVGLSLIALGVFSTSVLTGAALGLALVVVLGNIFSIYRGIFFGKEKGPAEVLDLSVREVALWVPLVLATVVLGFFPKILVEVARATHGMWLSLPSGGP